MKKLFMGMLGIVMAFSLCACENNKNQTESKQEKSSTENSEKDHTILEDNTNAKPKDNEEVESNNSLGTKSEDSMEAELKDSTEMESDAGIVEDGEGAHGVYNGEDVVELVNLRGDTTTVYKLADGRYMDRTERIFVFDGTETWTDEEGVQWNETVK